MNDNSNLLVFPGETPLEFDPKVILETAKNGGLDSVAVLGWTEDGNLFVSASFGDRAQILWLLKQAEKYVLDA